MHVNLDVSGIVHVARCHGGAFPHHHSGGLDRDNGHLQSARASPIEEVVPLEEPQVASAPSKLSGTSPHGLVQNLDAPLAVGLLELASQPGEERTGLILAEHLLGLAGSRREGG